MTATLPYSRLIGFLLLILLAGAGITKVVVREVLVPRHIREAADAAMLPCPLSEVARGLLVEHESRMIKGIERGGLTSAVIPSVARDLGGRWLGGRPSGRRSPRSLATLGMTVLFAPRTARPAACTSRLWRRERTRIHAPAGRRGAWSCSRCRGPSR